jgi:hypothetical protein
MPLRFRPEIANEEAIFIPLGLDNPALIKYPFRETGTQWSKSTWKEASTK